MSGFRLPNKRERKLFKQATGKKAPWCILWEAPYLFWSRWQGITLGPLVILRSFKRTDTLCHEMVHVRQYYRSFIIGFVVRYLYELATKGYRNISYEIEAYKVNPIVKELMNQGK